MQVFAPGWRLWRWLEWFRCNERGKITVTAAEGKIRCYRVFNGPKARAVSLPRAPTCDMTIGMRCPRCEDGWLSVGPLYTYCNKCGFSDQGTIQ
jgi:hypothetical protein